MEIPHVEQCWLEAVTGGTEARLPADHSLTRH